MHQFTFTCNQHPNSLFDLSMYIVCVTKRISFVVPKNNILVVRSLAILNEFKIPPM